MTPSSSSRPILTSRQRYDMAGTLLFAMSVCMGLSILPPEVLGAGTQAMFPKGNFMGFVGAVLYEWGWNAIGLGLTVLPVAPFVAALSCFGWTRLDTGVRWGAFLLGLSLLLPLAAFQFTAEAGSPIPVPWDAASTGWIGQTAGLFSAALLSWFGAMVLFATLALLLSTATIGINPIRWIPGFGPRAHHAVLAILAWVRRRGRREAENEEPEEDLYSVPEPDPETTDALSRLVTDPHHTLPDVLRDSPAFDAAAEDPESEDDRPARPRADLLKGAPPGEVGVDEAHLELLGNVLIETLSTFGVKCRIVGRTTGPVVTRFEVVPAPGVKVSRIANLDADLALALKAPSIRIVAPIPGKGAVGVEVPNPQPEVVYLRDLLETSAFQKPKAVLPLALGRDLSGKPYIADLEKMPHLLIAGATGAGKSICINSIVTSLIYRYGPESLRLLMIDPKRVELSLYKDLPHLRHPVVTDPKDSAMILKWAVFEMERRYGLLSANSVRSLREFNAALARGRAMVDAGPSGRSYDDGPLPMIVLVVDELADLMLQVQGEIEKPLAQLAQKARAIGIHLIVATQRPSVNVITGLIKANFPTRIAFRVSSKVDSRTILDQNGADALLGDGDMLFLPPGTAEPVRIQGSYLSTDDTARLMAWFSDRYESFSVVEEDVIESVRLLSAEDDSLLSVDEERDELFFQAAEICLQYQQGSTSLLQRRLRIGYGRAARIIDQLHNAGALGPPEGSKPREVLLSPDELDDLVA